MMKWFLNVFVEDGGDSMVALGERANIVAYWSLSMGFQKVGDLNAIPCIAEFQSGKDNCFGEKITVVCNNTASHDLDRCMASMSMHKNKTCGHPSINGLHVNKIGDHVSDSPQLNNDQGSSTSVDGLHAISNGVHVGMGSKPSTNKQASEQLLIMVGLTDWIMVRIIIIKLAQELVHNEHGLVLKPDGNKTSGGTIKFKSGN
ncbi:hypothetical protein L1987_10262 [Smallanthus sonchifolius]|uniref:Uncharacterized protein n=1 Tax=Smallanthus sonchifolius TaxID=185202 RepID=A0ACB9JRL8_9ASTR|nr:hypothetical protein L1987_10262 [Smallanthus sonchifolius]